MMTKERMREIIEMMMFDVYDLHEEFGALGFKAIKRIISNYNFSDEEIKELELDKSCNLSKKNLTFRKAYEKEYDPCTNVKWVGLYKLPDGNEIKISNGCTERDAYENALENIEYYNKRPIIEYKRMVKDTAIY